MDKIAELREEKSKLSNRISKIDQEIYQLQQICTHESLNISEPQVLEKWLYDMAYSYDKTGMRVIEKRNVACKCGFSRTEMRYTDSEWMTTDEWVEQDKVSE